MLYKQTIIILLLSIIYNVKTQTLDPPKISAAFYGEPLPTDDPKIYYMSVSTKVSNRYATTFITCRMKNPSVVGKEATFSVILPQRAFISNFVMEINNNSYQAYVKEKKEAQRIYDTAVHQGQGAAQVKLNARDSSRFSVNTFLQPEQRAVFHLTYEELLVRKLGKYEIVINVFPGQTVDNLQMDVTINETQPLKFVNSPFLRQGHILKGKELDTSARVSKMDRSASIQYKPNIFEQRDIARRFETGIKYGLAGQFVLQYDVKREANGGQVIQTKKNFAHFFAPVNTTIIPKYIVFVLDTSGSMDGDKMNQLKQAMQNILNKLNTEDSFNIIEFSSNARVWNVPTAQITYQENIGGSSDVDYVVDIKANVLPSYHVANKANVDKAIKILNLFEAYGQTNIFSALKVGLQLFEKNKQILNKTQSTLVFLTDGAVNQGLQDYNLIIDQITTLNKHNASIFTMSLGAETNQNFLDILSLKNSGNTKHIYESGDIFLQIESFFKEISSPQLKDIKFNYGSSINELTKSKFPTAYAGSELVVVGVKNHNIDMRHSNNLSISATSGNGKVQLVPSVETATDNIKRLWAYIQVKQLLEQRKIVDDNRNITKRALELALKYSFVTEVTSLVVVKPEETKLAEVETMKDGDFQEFQDADTRVPGWGRIDSLLISAQKSVVISFSEIIISTTPRSTTVPYWVPPISMDQEVPQRINKAKQEMPWLARKLSENGTLTTKLVGPLNLVFSSKSINPSPCSYVWNETRSNGVCVRMHECKHKYNIINDEEFLLKILCPLWDKQHYGLCCT